MINYPNGVKAKKVVNKTFDNSANRGMAFEEEINMSNEYYRKANIAIIYKKPTPIKIVHIENKGLKSGKITEAYFEQPSTTDYNGIYKGYYIDFEAKETMNKTSFPLANIHQHQITHLINTHKMGGISFIIVHFKQLNEVYIMDAIDVDEFNRSTRRSIPYSEFKKRGILVPQEYVVRLNYLKAVEELYDLK